MTFMKLRSGLVAALVLVCLAVTPLRAADLATPADKPAFKQEELEQMLAPIAKSFLVVDGARNAFASSLVRNKMG